ncbi:DUF397 domain-containing protein [Streptomyces sp. CS057]|uniref:DUF397 domain-containing protein n=1 Tax=Streptomyces sp. CS057 TaxID=1982764 RepID=UPI000B411285|nr:DUF397 domain-containing protein [Streptomyces sp. CS057]OWA24796.1 hypothetical protein B9W61_09865 [Streptomyces sp. CS057]
MLYTSELCWIKSSFSGDGGNNCVEVAAAEGGRVSLRDSTRPSRIIPTTRIAFHALVQGVKSEGFAPVQD